MIKVVSLFGSVDLQENLQEAFKKNRLVFVKENCQTEVQLLNLIEENNVDVVIIAAAAVDMSNFVGLVNEIYQLDEFIRIILILYGTREQYFKLRLDEYHKLQIDLIFDNNGFDAAELIDYAKRGKRTKKKNTTAKVEQQKPLIPSTNEEHYSIAVFGITRGAGVTSTVVSLARYFGLQNRNTSAVDFTGTKSLAFASCKEAQIVAEGQIDIDAIKMESKVVVFDFGVPYEIDAGGNIARISQRYNFTFIKEILKCDIKIGIGFLEPWHINKVKFFFDNVQWQSVIDNSYVFLFDGDPKDLKRAYPNINMYQRDEEEFREIILNLFSEGR